MHSIYPFGFSGVYNVIINLYDLLQQHTIVKDFTSERATNLRIARKTWKLERRQ